MLYPGTLSIGVDKAKLQSRGVDMRECKQVWVQTTSFVEPSECRAETWTVLYETCLPSALAPPRSTAVCQGSEEVLSLAVCTRWDKRAGSQEQGGGNLSQVCSGLPYFLGIVEVGR